MLKAVNPWLIVAALVACGLTFLYGLNVGEKLEQARAASTEQLAHAMEVAALKGAADAIARNRPINQYRREVVEREVRTVPDYSRCLHSDDSMRALNAALENKPLSSGDSVVSKADAASGQDIRNDHNETR
jgi:hypothetical protein